MIKKTILFILILLTLFLVPGVKAAEERIQHFEVDITINPDSSINITEKILYDFESLERHGIYRDIPFKYQARGGNYNLRLLDISVTDENEQAYKFKVSDEDNNKRIKIGDADVTISGQHWYITNYKVKRAINFFNEHDELYWNAIGTEWSVPISQGVAVVHLPSGAENDQVQKECFFGAVGSQGDCVLIEEGSQVIYAAENLAKGQGMTVVIGWPKGLVTEPPASDKFLDTLKDNGILVLPLIVFGIMFYLWRTRGRDPEGRGTIIHQYDPPEDLTPAEVGTIIDEQAHQRDISAEIIQLAVNGYLKITRIPGTGVFKKDDYELEKLKEEVGIKNEFQQILFKELFSGKDKIKISDLKEKFYKDLERVKKEVYQSVLDKKYFSKHPNAVRGTYAGIGSLVIFLGFIFAGSLAGGFGILATVLSGVIILIFGFFMPKKTHQGVLAKEHILGLKKYLSVAEKDRLEFHNAPQKDPQRFEKLLPYAMVLGVEKEWAKQFENIYDQQPSWYSDPTRTHFSAWYLTNALHSFQTNANTTLASRPSSAARGGSGFGGGGFSGGGFGGGGGGSW